MGVTDEVWGALTSMIKLEDKVNRRAEAMKAEQSRIEAGDSPATAAPFAAAARRPPATTIRHRGPGA